MARSLVESLAAKFRPDAYTDAYRAALEELIERKLPVLLRAGALRRGQVYLSQAEAWELMTVTGASLEAAGFEVRVPALSRRTPSPSLRLFTEPSGDTVVPRLCSANSPERCSTLGSMRSTLLGGLTLMVNAVNTIVLSVAAMKMPTPNAHSSSVFRIQRSCTSWGVSVIGHPTVPRGMNTSR